LKQRQAYPVYAFSTTWAGFQQDRHDLWANKFIHFQPSTDESPNFERLFDAVGERPIFGPDGTPRPHAQILLGRYFFSTFSGHPKPRATKIARFERPSCTQGGEIGRRSLARWSASEATALSSTPMRQNSFEPFAQSLRSITPVYWRVLFFGILLQLE
jgi:hypothetical protein